MPEIVSSPLLELCKLKNKTPHGDQSPRTVVHTVRPHCQLFYLWGVVVICIVPTPGATANAAAYMKQKGFH